MIQTNNWSGDVFPKVSIILPARNEETFIGRVLTALGRLDYPPERYEVIIVDNASTDATAEIAGAMGAMVVKHPRGRVGAVRNAGARVASGSILAFLDADCVVPRTWLRGAVEALGEPRVGAVGGACTAPKEGSWVERAWAARGPTTRDEVTALAASSMIISHAFFDRLGGFDESLVAGEDDDLSYRIRARGERLVGLPACDVVHLGYPTTLRDVLRRQVWHGRSQLQVARGRLDPLLVLTHLFAIDALLVLAVATTGFSYILAAALLTSGALAAGAAIQRTRGRPKNVPQLTVIFWFFLLGRSVGLALSYWDLLRARLRSGTTQAREDPR